MTAPAKPVIECDQLHPGIEVRDLTAAIDFYVNKLGFFQAFTWGEPPTFAGVNLGRVQIFLKQGTPTPSANTAAASFLVDDVDALYEFHRANGIPIAAAIDDRPYGIRDYAVRDADGYYLSFGQHLMAAGPPIKIERVAVQLRLEEAARRAAARSREPQEDEHRQLPRGNPPPHQRRRRAAHEEPAALH